MKSKRTFWELWDTIKEFSFDDDPGEKITQIEGWEYYSSDHRWPFQIWWHIWDDWTLGEVVNFTRAWHRLSFSEKAALVTDTGLPTDRDYHNADSSKVRIETFESVLEQTRDQSFMLLGALLFNNSVLEHGPDITEGYIDGTGFDKTPSEIAENLPMTPIKKRRMLQGLKRRHEFRSQKVKMQAENNPIAEH